MRRQLYIVLSVFVVLTILAVVAIWILIVPKYQARGEVRVRPIVPRLVFDTEDNGLIPFYNSYVNTQVSIIRSQTILQRVLDQREVQNTEWYKNSSKSIIQELSGNQVPALERIRNCLSAKPRSDTELIDVSFIAEKPEDTRVILDTVLDQYLRYTREMSNETQDRLYQQLAEQYKALETEIVGREAVIAGLRRSIGTLNPRELLSKKRLHIEETQTNLERVQQNIALLEWQIKNSNTADSNEPAVDTPGTMELQLKQAQYEKQLLHAKLEKQMRDFNDFFVKAQLYEKEHNELNYKRELFDTVRRRREQKEMERNVPAGTIDVLMGSFVSSKPYNDHRILFTIIALVLWLGMSSGMGFLFRIRMNSSDKNHQK